MPVSSAGACFDWGASAADIQTAINNVVKRTWLNSTGVVDGYAARSAAANIVFS